MVKFFIKIRRRETNESASKSSLHVYDQKAYTFVEDHLKKAGINIPVHETISFTHKMNKREIQLLQEYKQLDFGRDPEGAVAPSPEAILLAEYIVEAMDKRGQKVFHVAPGPRGEIMVDIRNSGRSLELLFYPHSNNKYVFFSENNEAEQGDFVFSLLPKLLNRLNA